MGRILSIFAKMKWLVAILLVALCLPVVARAQELSALARIEPAQSYIRDAGQGAEIRFSLSQPVPWRVRFRADPPRLVLDVREVDWTGVEGVLQTSDHVRAVRAGVFRPGWSRLVLELSGPMALSLAEMSTQNDTKLALRLDPTSAEAFAAAAAQPELPGWGMPNVTDLAKPPARVPGRWIVVLDAGHGGIDPGAERDGQSEADLVLQFAREFKEILLRDGRFQVVMTREEDVFVPLETRISIARAAEADVFLSLHADALAEGEAKIVAELQAARGKPADIGGYYHADPEKLAAVMRPSATLNAAASNSSEPCKPGATKRTTCRFFTSSA